MEQIVERSKKTRSTHRGTLYLVQELQVRGATDLEYLVEMVSIYRPQSWVKNKTSDYDFNRNHKRFALY